MKNNAVVHDSSGNIFEDRGMADADERLANAERIRGIRQRMQADDVSPADAAAIAGITEAELANALRGRYSRMMAGRMRRLANALGIGSMRMQTGGHEQIADGRGGGQHR
jgi:hypothetical protein